MALRQKTLGTLAGGWLAIVAFAAVMTPPLPVRAAPVVQVGPLIEITPGRSPFRGCTADRPGQQAGMLYPNTEIEPFVDINPADPDTIVVGWQQDRWDNGGARGDLSASQHRRRRHLAHRRRARHQRLQRRRVRPELRPVGQLLAQRHAYYMTLAFEEDLPSGSFGRNAMLVSRSRTGGRTWGAPITLIEDERADPPRQELADGRSQRLAFRLCGLGSPAGLHATAGGARSPGRDGGGRDCARPAPCPRAGAAGADRLPRRAGALHAHDQWRGQLDAAARDL